ncbi:hypothetical protein D0T49_10995 [Paludibacter sp. 221]|uniref:FtsL-like putative cell division protein n=1 Tax=Paludibacter sp. 221 TaxID=2302939 RepID=UPI0013D053D0|nr:FtsL-like putative cell division protein [Paludibacter sp. 221]NDV47574.1 hypothetical protein [Paludibacter sp. 221]
MSSIKGSEDYSDIKSSSLRDLLNGNILTKKFIQKQYGLLIMAAVLAFVYVGNRYYCETQMNKENKLKRELKDVKYESLTLSAELIQMSRRSHVLKLANEKGLGLVEATTPPIKLD